MVQAAGGAPFTTEGVGLDRPDFGQPDEAAGADHAAHVAGRVCDRCGQPIEASQDARRRGESGWIHDVCPG